MKKRSLILLLVVSFVLIGCTEEKVPDEIPEVKKEVPQIQQEFPKPEQESITQKTSKEPQQEPKEGPEEDETIYNRPDLPSCGNKMNFFTAYPVDLANLKLIRPLGFIGSAPEHIFPTDHVYLGLKRDSSDHPIEVPVYSPGDVWITRIKEFKYLFP